MSLEKTKRKKKGYKKLQKRDGFQKQKQTVIVNINKQKRTSVPRNNGIEKPKEKEQPKTYNSFNFSMPQAHNPISDYLKVYNRDLFAKIEQAIKTKDSVINSTNEVLLPIPTPTSLDNYLKNQEALKKPLVIREPIVLPVITTIDEPQSLDDLEVPEVPTEEITQDTVDSLKKTEEPPDLNAYVRRGRGPDKQLRIRRTQDQILLDENRKIGLLETRGYEYVRDKRINPPNSPSSLNLGSNIIGTVI